MTKSIQFLKVFALILVIALFSCKKDEGLSSLTLNSDVVEVDVGLDEEVKLTVVGNDGEIYTNSAVFYVDGTQIENTNFKPENAGTYTITAKYNEITSNELKVTAVNNLTSITLNCNPDGLVGGRLNFTVTSSYETDVTNYSEFYVNGSKILEGGYYNIPDANDFELYAKYKGLQSETKTIKAIVPTHSTKILVEDYTGSWCQFCPRIAYLLEEAVSNNSNIIPVAIHSEGADNAGYGMRYEYIGTMAEAFEVTGLPTAKINRIHTWGEDAALFDPYIETPVGLGLGINSNKTGNDLEITVKVGFDLNYSNELKLIVYLLEDDLIYDQTNSTSYYGGVNPIVDFEHDNVLRKAYTDVMGDVIDASQTISGNIFSKTFNVTVSSNVEDASKLEVVAFVVNGSTNEVINAQSAAVGVNQDFD